MTSPQPDQDETTVESQDLREKEMEELEKGFHETMQSIQTIKDCKEIMGCLQDYILELLTGDEDEDQLKDSDDGGSEGATGHTDTLSEMEKEKLRASKEDATERYEMFKKTLAEGAKETFKCDMKDIDDQIEKIRKDLEEMDAGMKLFEEQEEVFKKINPKELP